jgi:Transposase DDE domain
MKTQDGFQQCYNTQIAVEGESRLIVAAEVTQDAADNKCLVPPTEAAEAHGGEKPEWVLADTGIARKKAFGNWRKRKSRPT